MRLRIYKRPRGFEIHYTQRNGRKILSYPVVREGLRPAWAFYPYILFASLRAIRQHAKVFKGVPYKVYRS